MAELVRRYWSDIDTEVQRLLGSPDNTNITTRIQHWIADTYFQIGTRWHHYELEEDDDSKVLKTGQSVVTIPENTYIILGVATLDSNGLVDSWVTLRDPRIVQAAFTSADGKPLACARLGNRIIFDREADTNYRLRITRYKFPTVPDFTTTSTKKQFPETSRLWDDPIIVASAAKAHTRLWSSHIGQQFAGDFEVMVSFIPQPLMAEFEITDRGEKQLIDEPMGGGQ